MCGMETAIISDFNSLMKNLTLNGSFSICSGQWGCTFIQLWIYRTQQGLGKHFQTDLSALMHAWNNVVCIIVGWAQTTRCCSLTQAELRVTASVGHPHITFFSAVPSLRSEIQYSCNPSSFDTCFYLWGHILASQLFWAVSSRNAVGLVMPARTLKLFTLIPTTMPLSLMTAGKSFPALSFW